MLDFFVVNYTFFRRSTNMNELSAKVTYASVTPIAENSLTFVLDRVFSGGAVIRHSDTKYSKKLVSGKALLLHLAIIIIIIIITGPVVSKGT